MFDWRNVTQPRWGKRSSPAAKQIQCRAPTPLVAVLAAVLFGPQLAMAAVLLAQYSRIHVGAVLLEWAPVIIAKLALWVALAWTKVPVQVDSEGMRFAWLFRLAWADIVSVRVSSWFGLRVLEIEQRQGRPWRIWLYWFEELPMFLASHAPADSPVQRM
jgi:hypothetical protein